ncbi:unnamed protein product [Periconia digitata]|uniref:Uncharacterized protein n=1 Tax=Periconia digitata TaxID=1303443 RepID=A0A9W4UEF0_9PLEO|nr:unnamed protein product [Periconia digitata]
MLSVIAPARQYIHVCAYKPPKQSRTRKGKKMMNFKNYVCPKK